MLCRPLLRLFAQRYTLQADTRSPCLVCQQPLYHRQHGICSVCKSHFPLISFPCRRCGMGRLHINSRCIPCQNAPVPWDSLIAIADYSEPFTYLLAKLKYQQQFWLAEALARQLLLTLLTARREHPAPWPDLILPVPLQRQRQWWRGFNQSEYLARALSHWLKIPLDPDALIRYKRQRAQHTLRASERRHNQLNTYAVTKPLRGLRVALLDDVVTTGSTVSVISHALREQGVRHIQIWCLCRTQ
ncbi:MAG: phosphoribosyltransferase family protein [Plesiomonas sp.]|uniref:phosphoribosyltransferase family protein n=1 Tax=Plesiomonas sp. TaxID=2486279 RepID=UPI003F36E15B